MSDIQKDIVLNEDGDYQSIEFKKVDLGLIEWIEKKYKMDVRNGEILFIHGKLYWTSKGCSRISESKRTKSIRFEYIDPNKFSLPMISQNPSKYIIVKCLLEKEDGGIIESIRILDLIKEKRLKFPRKCDCGNEKKYFRKTEDPEVLECPKCKKQFRGEEYWLLKDYISFAETKAFMRACKLAYSVSIEDDILEDDRDQAIDITNVKQVNNRNKEVQVEVQEKPEKPDYKPVSLNPISLNPIQQSSAKPIYIKPNINIKETTTQSEQKLTNSNLNRPKSLNESMPLQLKTNVDIKPKENNISTKKILPYEQTKRYTIGSLELPSYSYKIKELDYEFLVCWNNCREYLEKKDPKLLSEKWNALVKEFDKSVEGKESINLRIVFFELFKEIISPVDQINVFNKFESEFTNDINRAIYFAYSNTGLPRDKFHQKLGEHLMISPEFESYFVDLLELNRIVSFNPTSEFLPKDYEVKQK